MQPEITLRQFVGAYPNPTYQSDSDLCIFNRDFFLRYLLVCTLYIFICTRVSNVCLREHFWEQEENSKQHPSGCIYTIELMKITVSKIQVCDLQGLRFDILFGGCSSPPSGQQWCWRGTCIKPWLIVIRLDFGELALSEWMMSFKDLYVVKKWWPNGSRSTSNTLVGVSFPCIQVFTWVQAKCAWL